MNTKHKYNTRNISRFATSENITLVTSESTPEKPFVKIINSNSDDGNSDDGNSDDGNSDDGNSDDGISDGNSDGKNIAYDDKDRDEELSEYDSDDDLDEDELDDVPDYIEEQDDLEQDDLEQDDLEISRYEYAKFLNRLFPSNYTRDKSDSLKRRRLLSPISNINNINYYIYSDSPNNHSNHSNHIDDDENYIVDVSNENNDLDEAVKCADNPKPKSKLTEKQIQEKKAEAEIKRISNKNYNEYKKIFEQDSNAESKYFKTILTVSQQESVINKLKKIGDITVVKKPYLIHLAELDIPDIYKACAINKINQLENMDQESANGEYYKLKCWIDNFMKIPFGKYTNIPIHVSDGLERCNEFIADAKHILDTCVFGLDNAKLQILQLIGMWIVNPESIGTTIAIKGPMGVGKTTLVKHGISKILNRYFTLLPLGGANDISYFEGHGYTYEGSTYGKIIDILIQSRQMNPIIYFDELDKLSESPKGDEITGLLTHLTDTTQNSCYHDKYFSEIDFDLSKILYIFSYNDETKINRILLDRMYNIEIKGYTVADKLAIANMHLLPKIRSNIAFTEDEIVLEEEVIKYIIEKYTDDEEGVRYLKRCLETIYTKLNLIKLLKPDNDEIFKLLNITNNTRFPIKLTKAIVDKLLHKREQSTVPFGMYN